MKQSNEVEEIKVKVTNTTADTIIEGVEVFAPDGNNDGGIEITSMTKGLKYEELLGSMLLLPTTKFLIQTVGVGEDKSAAFTPFRLHTLNANKGDYAGRSFAPQISGEAKGSWLSPKPVKWGGKNKYTKLILESLPANSSVIIILTPYVEPEPLTAPAGASNYFLNTEVVTREKVTVMKSEEMVEKLKADRPKEIFNLTISNEKPYVIIESYDDEQEGCVLRLSTWKRSTPDSFYNFDALYKLLKKEGLKSIVY